MNEFKSVVFGQRQKYSGVVDSFHSSSCHSGLTGRLVSVRDIKTSPGDKEVCDVDVFKVSYTWPRLHEGYYVEFMARAEEVDGTLVLLRPTQMKCLGIAPMV